MCYLSYNHPCGFSKIDHGTDNYGTGGHNWYMTARIDVWFDHPDGYRWWGYLITGGYNQTLRVRRVKNSPVLRAFSADRGNPDFPDSRPALTKRFWRWDNFELRPDEEKNLFRIDLKPGVKHADRFWKGSEYAFKARDAWHFGPTKADAITNALAA